MLNTRGISIVCLILGLSLLKAGAENTAGPSDQPYYGFYPSEKGESYKKLMHNLLGFSIEIPASWTFGINGAPPVAVAMLYPEGLLTNKLSADYELVEIGRIAPGALEEAQRVVMAGMESKHPGIRIVQKPKGRKLQNRSAISWAFEWPSKTGYSVHEYITLVDDGASIRSLAVRTTGKTFRAKRKFFDEIVSSFKPLSGS